MISSEEIFWLLVDTDAQILSATMPLDEAYTVAYQIVLQNPGEWNSCAY